jgi:hypothetical protein
MEKTSPASPKSKIKLPIKLPYPRISPPVAAAILIAVLLAGFGIYKLATRHRGPAPLESVAYMREHCPIVVAINVGAGFLTDEQSGVSVRGKKSVITAKKPSVTYTWHLSKQDEFCGIVGGWYGPKYVSLRPTSQTAHGGEYTDLSQKDAASPAGSLQQFTVYARPVSR